MSEKDIKNYNLKLDNALPDEKELIDFLKDKPVKFIFKEALFLYKRTYLAAFHEDRVEPSPSNKFFAKEPEPVKQEEDQKTAEIKKFFGRP